MIKNYKEIQGVLIKKYRNILGQYIFILEENGIKSKVRVGKMIYIKAELGTNWTIGHIGGKLVNTRPDSCKIADE